MRAILLTGTVDSPVTEEAIAGLMALLDPSWLRINIPLTATTWQDQEWGGLWQEVSALWAAGSPLLLVFGGSLADPMTARTTLADVAHAWRLGVVLTLPVSERTLPLAAAFLGLTQSVGVKLKGWILLDPSAQGSIMLPDLMAQVQTLTQTPVLLPDLEVGINPVFEAKSPQPRAAGTDP